MPWVGGEFSAIASFPDNLRIGLGSSRPDAFDIDQGIWSLSPKRLRDRDEYLMGLIKNGAGASEGLDVSGIEVGGFSKNPQAIFRSGLSSVQNGSFSDSPDLNIWAGGWRTVIRTVVTTTAPISVMFASANFTAGVIAKIGNAGIDFRIVVDGIQVSLSKMRWRAAIPADFVSDAMNWTSLIGPGIHEVRLELQVELFLSPFKPTFWTFNQFVLASFASPSLAVLVT